MFFRPSWLKSPTIWISLLIVTALCLKAIFSGTFGVIGSDNDDIMRLIQIRDFIDGQNWFDVNQYRMGPEGTVMHWSRLADVPILILIGVFDIVLPYETAESLAISLWPPLSALGVIWGILTGVKHVSGAIWPKARIFALVLLVFILVLHYRFAPGSIDHHNLQIGLLAICVGNALDPQLKFKSGLFAGIALALSLAVGGEVYALVAVICGFFAFMFLWKGADMRDGILGFGAAFAVTLIGVFFVTIAPQNYGAIYCDAYSLITLSVGVLGGGGLALLALTLSKKPVTWRLGGLVILALLCAALLWLQAPQCLANPLSELPPDVQSLWLNNVMEARPLFFDREAWFYTPPFAIGTTCVAVIVTVLALKAEKRPGQNILLLSLLVMSLMLTVYQIRFYVFGTMFALFVLAPWVAGIYIRQRETDDGPTVGYIMALAVSIPILWGFPAVFLKDDTPTDNAGPANATACYSETVLEALSKLDPGLIIATDNGTPYILMETQHRALSGNYHRNSAGIASSIKVFTSPADLAKVEIKKTGAKYLHLCRTTKESTLFSDHAPQGLMGDLLKGEVPHYLSPIGEDLEDGAVTLYRITL